MALGVSKQLCLSSYSLQGDEDGVISWHAPDGNTYRLDPRGAPPRRWKFTDDDAGRHVMAFMPQPPTNAGGYTRGLHNQLPEENPTGDGVLVVSLDGAPGLAATLLHEEDDIADRRYYFATDRNNNNPLERPAFVLRAVGIRQSPVKPFANFQVLVIE